MTEKEIARIREKMHTRVKNGAIICDTRTTVEVEETRKLDFIPGLPRYSRKARRRGVYIPEVDRDLDGAFRRSNRLDTTT